MATSTMKFPGISNELQMILDAKMDEVSARRRAREAFKDVQLGIDHILFKVSSLTLLSLDLFFFFCGSFNFEIVLFCSFKLNFDSSVSNNLTKLKVHKLILETSK